MSSNKPQLRTVSFEVPDDLHHKLKIKVAHQGVSMKAFLTDLITKAVKDVDVPQDEFAGKTQITLDENWTKTKPYGFRFKGQAYKGFKSWVRGYEAFCRELAAVDPTRFEDLPNNPVFRAGHKRELFTYTPTNLRKALDTGSRVYVEGSLAANGFRDNIRDLLDEFGIDGKDLELSIR